ncbi:DUF2059 domain-containing protein [Alistipes sp. AM16-43]|nr:DUF2059 domain-containing protein [Alistipes sp. AM16-43]
MQTICRKRWLNHFVHWYWIHCYWRKRTLSKIANQMKKFIFLIAIAIGSMVCTAARAQTTKEAYKQELRTYMESSGSTASFDTMVNQLFMMAGGIPAEKKAEIRTQAFDKLVDLMTPVYQKNITLEDLKEINKFYQTPAGKRISGAQPKIAVESTQVGQQWGMWLQSAIQTAAK